MPSLPSANEAAAIAEERPDTDGAYAALVARLSRQSVDKHFDAYADVDWQHPDLQVDPTDPRWAASLDEPLTQTDWFAAQPPDVQATIGLHLVVARMKLGLQFENVLQRGLLDYAMTLDNGDPEFRYLYHEVIEESQHTLMFQELVNRSGLDPRGLRPVERFGTRLVVSLAHWAPALFFFFVLGGEDPIDHVQRRALRSGTPLHPLLERIVRIHVTEEARHLSFARNHLKQVVPRLDRFRRAGLAVAVPLVLGSMAKLMLDLPGSVVRTYGVPRDVVRRAYRHNPAHRAAAVESVRKVRQLAGELGLLGPVPRLLWRLVGLG